ncbi:hypothetical protein LAZ67_15000317 [Cordylochernes scorpioides]|uniref:PiggyBac transposable element-derived protein domain-containing protein n=1 Tax=Cordylochernes scorpioides TaxID=51811 RepID=A0ABY6L7Z9_9ARAC|nr:hypothetical protein LAZ67_15000317 [Cordylochernes scorpioides]
MEIEESLLVYMVNEEDLGDNRHSEQNSEADEELPNDDSEFYFGKDGVTKWKKTMWQKTQIRTRSVNIISQLPGPKSEAKSIESESDAFTKIIDDDMVQKIVDCTNAYISNIKEHFSRERDAKLTTVTEILALFGLLIMSGVKRAAHLTYKELWAVDGSGVEIVRAIMSQDRFLFLLRCLRFDDITTRKERKKLDKLTPIREFVEAFVYNCKKLYTPGEYNTIDEKLIPFRGRNRPKYNCIFGFTQNTTLVSYIPKKSKAVLLLSTMHSTPTTDEESGFKLKPEIVTFYNLTKGGVDMIEMSVESEPKKRKRCYVCPSTKGQRNISVLVFTYTTRTTPSRPGKDAVTILSGQLLRPLINNYDYITNF